MFDSHLPVTRDPALTDVLKDWPDLPYRTLKIAPLETLVDRMSTGMEQHRIVLDPQGRGAAAWCHLPWDSGIFGVSMARLDLIWAKEEDPDLLRHLLDKVIQDARSEGVQHMAHRPEMARQTTIHLLEDCGFRMVDSLHTLYYKVTEPKPAAQVRAYQPSDRDAILAMAATAFERNRFASDPHLDTHMAEEIYIRWTDNCLSGKRGDWVGVRIIDGEPAGFITCLLQPIQGSHMPMSVGVIDLIAVNPKYHGRGVGMELVHAAQNWMGVHSALHTVGTRCDNFQALSLYLKAGFRIYSSKVGMHAWLK